MKLEGEQVLLRIHLSNFARWQLGPLYEALVTLARDAHLAGATVLSGVYGYVDRGRLLGEHPNTLRVERPLVIELVDTDAAIQRFMHEVDALVQEGLVTLEAVKIVSYGERSG